MVTLGGPQAGEEWRSLTSSMVDIGYSEADMQAIYTILAVVLHLGNISFRYAACAMASMPGGLHLSRVGCRVFLSGRPTLGTRRSLSADNDLELHGNYEQAAQLLGVSVNDVAG